MLLSDQQLLAFPSSSLLTLRAALLRDGGPDAATYLREAGYAGGEALFAAFRDWLATSGDPEPETLTLATFERRVSEFFRECGWGTLQLVPLGEALAALDTADWREAEPGAALDQPGCHYTTGLLAYFVGYLAEHPLSVLEVECRSAGAERCRFLVGAPAAMEQVYEVLVGRADAGGTVPGTGA